MCNKYKDGGTSFTHNLFGPYCLESNDIMSKKKKGKEGMDENKSSDTVNEKVSSNASDENSPSDDDSFEHLDIENSDYKPESYLEGDQNEDKKTQQVLSFIMSHLKQFEFLFRIRQTPVRMERLLKNLVNLQRHMKNNRR